VTVARDLARRAGEIVLSVRGDLGPEVGTDEGAEARSSRLGVEMKDGNEPVTIADMRSSQFLVEELGRAFPGDIIISEETADDPRRLGADRVWFIDPIDGTKDFIRGDKGWSVMIGLCVAARPVVGVVHQPTGDRTFWAGPGGGGVTIAGVDHPLGVSSTTDPTNVRLVASASHRSDAIDRVKGALGIDNELNIGSVGVKMGLIAAGERDLYVNPWPKCKAWDTCAPEAILTRAGGKVTDLHGDAVRYDTPELGRTLGLVASNGHLHAAVLAKLAPLFPRS
jgi:3'(2'), 5'-bisphosphate nucleotidase